MKRLLIVWCWVTEHKWYVVEEWHRRDGNNWSWIRDAKCARCGLRPFPIQSS